MQTYGRTSQSNIINICNIFQYINVTLGLNIVFCVTWICHQIMCWFFKMKPSWIICIKLNINRIHVLFFLDYGKNTPAYCICYNDSFYLSIYAAYRKYYVNSIFYFIYSFHDTAFCVIVQWCNTKNNGQHMTLILPDLVVEIKIFFKQ